MSKAQGAIRSQHNHSLTAEEVLRLSSANTANIDPRSIQNIYLTNVPFPAHFENQFEAQSPVNQDEVETGVILDHASGLHWHPTGQVGFDWRQAQAYVDRLNQIQFGGFHDWRFPTLEEAVTLISAEEDAGGRCIDPCFGPMTLMWTGDFLEPGLAWCIYFRSDARVGPLQVWQHTGCVLPVRPGEEQIPPSEDWLLKNSAIFDLGRPVSPSERDPLRNTDHAAMPDGQVEPSESQWAIDYVATRSRESYFESDCHYEHRVRHRASGDIVKTFSLSEYSNAEGSSQSGTVSVVLSEDGKSVISTDSDGTQSTHALPERKG
jgi:hypothetical protein